MYLKLTREILRQHYPNAMDKFIDDAMEAYQYYTVVTNGIHLWTEEYLFKHGLRPIVDRLQIFAQFTIDLAQLSKCTERKVAAIITDRELAQIYSIGINGGPKKLQDCMCVTEGKYGCLHAEINCLNKNTNTDDGKVMIVTLAPCKQCAAAIINAPGSFSTVYYVEDWKEEAGLRLLRAAGIQVVKL